MSVELYQGVVLAPTRATGLAGAYAALGDGVDGLGQNAAASSVRAAYSTDWFDYDISLGISLPGAFGSTDFDNSGLIGINATTLFTTVGGLVQFGPFGVGVLTDFQRYSLRPQGELNPQHSTVTIGRLHATAGYTFMGDQLNVGVGIRGVTASVNTTAASGGSTKNVLTMVGFTPELGALFRPDDAPWRLGATYRFAVGASAVPGSAVATDPSGVRRTNGLVVPESVHAPWEFEAGVALSAGPKPLNPAWLDPHQQEAALRAEIENAERARKRARDIELSALTDPVARKARAEQLDHEERYLRAQAQNKLEAQTDQLHEQRKARYENWPREGILVVAAVLVTGTTPQGVGLQSFLRQEDAPSGARITTQPRLGIEGEPVINRVMARVGTYLEPSRYEIPHAQGLIAGARQHFTFGIDWHVFAWDIFGLLGHTEWRLSFVGDIAPRYQNIGLSIGTWH